MRKTIVTVFFTTLSLIFFIQASASLRQDSLLLIHSGKLVSQRDTLFAPSTVPDPVLSYQNLVYKKRLDSIQKEVSLSYNEHVQRYIDIYTGRKEQIGKMLGLSEYYFPIFEKALKEAGIPEELKFLTVVESALNPQAVSRSGAVGPWQFMYATAKGYGLVMDNYTDERKDPVKASYAAARYLFDAHARIGDWLLAIAAFNCGTGAVTRAIAKSGGVADFWKVRPFLPVQTQNYVPAFIATVYSMKFFKDHEISVKPAGFSTLTDVIPVNKRISISSIAAATDLDVKELLLLNPSFKKEVVNGSASTPIPLVLPSVKNNAYKSLYDLFNGTTEMAEPAPLIAAAKKPAPSRTELSKKASPYLYYTVKPGDTLSEIAEKKGSTVSKIQALNGLKKSSIKAGMRLKINRT
ncbi:MAG TPA: transglycosylase SLT domain-containing protein [Daejeonella sp.]|uniref:lytic transglycosylase domain-containing protein n=1 Tax=Daejeonella sp. TaxID=2805397 RepID=UPI002ED8DD47